MSYAIHLVDCLEFMRTMADHSVDIITDPPYGVGRDKGFEGERGFGGVGAPIASRRNYEESWDEEPPPKEYFDEILRVGKSILIFGGNYFTDKLPVGRHWIVWDKLNTMPTFSDCELIWTNDETKKSIKRIVREYNGLIGREEHRYHPTQKPVAGLLTVLVEKYTTSGGTVFDPFMGSGSTGVAAIRMGRDFIGCEKWKRYYDDAAMRLSQESMQLKLF